MDTKSEALRRFSWQNVTSELMGSTIQRLQLASEAEEDLLEKFQQDWLTPQLRATFDIPVEKRTDEENKAIDREVDRFLITMAEKLGPGILVTRTAIFRVMRWHDDHLRGVKLLEEFMEAIVRSAKKRRGNLAAKPDRFTKAGRRQLMDELDILRRRMKGEAASSRRQLNFQNMLSIIHNDPSTFKLITCNLRSLLVFQQQREAFVDEFVVCRIPVGQFASEWIDWSEGGNSAKHFDNLLSEVKA